MGGWLTFAPPRLRLPHPPRFSAGGHCVPMASGGLQTPFSEDLSRMWAGGMWHVDPTHNTFITTGNAGSESTGGWPALTPARLGIRARWYEALGKK